MFAEQFTGPGGDIEDDVRSSHALDVLAEIYAGDGLGSIGQRQGAADEIADKNPDKAKKILLALGKTWDPVRKGYWDYRIRILEAGQEALARQGRDSPMESTGRGAEEIAVQ